MTFTDRRDQFFISAEELAILDTVRILDVRFTPDQGAQVAEFEREHIPGAVFVDLPSTLAGVQDGTSGRLPLPEVEVLRQALEGWGISDGDGIVVYDDRHGITAARAWWTLTWAGLRGVRVLDGGFSHWKRLGLPVESGTSPTVPRGTATVTPGALRHLDADETQAFPPPGVLVDARGRDQYEGGQGDDGRPTGGHIPGAVNLPTTSNLDDNGLLKPASVLSEQYGALGIDGSAPVATYCGGGIAASHQALVLATLGVDAALFVGSWSAWTADPSRPVATGTKHHTLRG